MEEIKEELKSLLMKVKEESGKAGLNSTFRKLRSWHPVPSLHGKEKGEKWKQWQILFGGASKITVECDCSREIKRLLFLGRKAMTNLGYVLNSRDITLPANIHRVKAMVFPVVMYRCESWTIKKAECWRVDVFELWCWRRLLSVPWTARSWN